MRIGTVFRLRGQAAIAFVLGGGLLLAAVAMFAAIAWNEIIYMLSHGLPTSLDSLWLPVLLLVFPLVLLFPSFIVLVRGKQSLARITAMNGRPNSMIDCRIQAHPEQAPDIAARPLVFNVAVRWQDRRVFVFISAVLPGVLLVLLAALDVRVSMPLGVGTWTWASIVFVYSVTLIFGVTPPIRVVYGVARTITADSQGLKWTTLLGGKRSMPWSEARLLEVDRDGQKESTNERRILFTLYGERRLLRWREMLDWRAAQRMQPLLDLIAARAGLTPRTFDAALGPSRFDQLPVTIRFPGKFLTVSAERSRKEAATALRGDYSVAWRPNSPRPRTTLLLVGILLTLFDAVEAARMLGALGVAIFRPIAAIFGAGDATREGAIIAFFVLALLFGPLLIIATLRREQPSMVTATDDALVATLYRKTTKVPWSSLREVQRWEVKRGHSRFRAVDITGSSEIGWPIQPQAWPRSMPHNVGMLVTSEEFARIVGARIEAAVR